MERNKRHSGSIETAEVVGAGNNVKSRRKRSSKPEENVTTQDALNVTIGDVLWVEARNAFLRAIGFIENK
jgi:hypothetical protein